MTTMKRPVAAAGAAILLGLTLTACGGNSYPDDASTKDFCSRLGDIVTATTSVKGDEPTEAEWKKVQKSFEELGDTGTPKGISDDARQGFEVVVDRITDLDYDEAKKEFGDKGGDDDIVPGISKDDGKKVDKFFSYADKKCADQLGG